MMLLMRAFTTRSVGNGFPDASNTGVPPGTSLTPSGGFTTSSNNQVIDSLDITGSIEVAHSGCIIRKCRINVVAGPGTTGIHCSHAGTLLIEDCDIIGADTPGGGAGSWAFTGLFIEDPCDATVRRCNVRLFENCIWIESDGDVYDNYFHDPVTAHLELPEPDQPHVDTFQVPSGISNLHIHHNTIQAHLQASACITFGSGMANVLVENNLLWGGFVCFRMGEGGSAGTNCRVPNNRFSQALDVNVGDIEQWSLGTDVDATGNVFHESGLNCDP